MASPLALLSHPVVWDASRRVLDLTLGLYRRRRRWLAESGILPPGSSLLDVGCGIGHYATATDGPYLGLDMSAEYIAYAERRQGGPRRHFRCVDLAMVRAEGQRFDVVLGVDVLHHLSPIQCGEVLRDMAAIAGRYVVHFEPVTEQTNPAGQWFIDNDRGEYMRPHDAVRTLLEAAGLVIERDEELYLGPIRTFVFLSRPLRG